jgi:ribosomal protein S12 methylthiotransferase accessory factor
MLTRPVFKSSYAVEVVGGEHVLLLHERGHHLLSGPLFVTVALLVDGNRTLDEIVDAAAPAASMAEVFYAMERLERLGVIREARNGMPPEELAFWDSVGVDPADAAEGLAKTSVSVSALDATSAANDVSAALASAGFDVVDDGELRVVLVDDYLRPELADLNRDRLDASRPWLLARPAGSMLWVGPLFVPGRTACWECMAHRMRAHRLTAAFIRNRRNDDYPRLAAHESLPSTALTAAALIATEAAKWAAGSPYRALEGTLITFDLLTAAMRRHAVVRRPQCRACGEPRIPHPEPLTLTSRIKRASIDAGHRSESPEATLARYRHHVSPLTGVVRELTRGTGTDPQAAPVYYSGYNPSTRDDTIESLRGRFRANAGGKGQTVAQAKASALCEAIERYSGVFQGDEPRIRATYESLGDAAIHPNASMLYSAAQYATRNEGPRERYERVPLPFDPGMETEWSPLWSLTAARFEYLPTALCFYDYPLPRSQRFGWADSNGCAAGNSVEEALLQGFFELVERDSVALWWFSRAPRPAVDLHSFAEPYFDTIARYYRSLGRDLWVLDLTADLGIPAFTAISRRIEGPEQIVVGFGAHLDPRVGIVRALTEANQMLPAAAAHRGERASETANAAAANWLDTASVDAHPYLGPHGTPRRADDYPDLQHDDLKEEVETCLRIVTGHGMELLVLDQTRPDIALPVVKVVVPGLRHFWTRFAPGRLYDVPPALGWIPERLTETQLNPTPVFF